MKACLITIGDEILIGQTVNTNVSFIGEQLTNLQIDVIKSIVIGDDEETIMHEFNEAYKSSDLIIVTGGLGPTHDDVTKSCVAKFFKSDLIKNEDVLNDIKQLFKKRGREVTESNEQQALVPKIAEVIRNSRGTAPGMWIEKSKKIFVVMPGVPYEMKEMMISSVVPKLDVILGERKEFTIIKNLMTTGIAESHLYEKLGNINELLNGSKLAFLPNQFGVKLRMTVKASKEVDAQNKLSELEQRIRAIAGRYIYGKDDEKIEEVIGRLMVDRGIKIAVAESCTGGLISSRLTNVSGSSSYFDRGVVAYSNAAKVEILRVDEDLLQKYGAVSLEVARLMAEGVKAISGSDIGLSVTGIMGPTGATPNKPVGLVYVGICDDNLCTAKEFRFGDDRLLNKDRTAQAALEMVRRNLLGIPYDE
ncbi:MAG: competence/damage-inducible protein A [Melioribacteraceae bacterium]|nr:MAG: competence/damage-inducible protein A [Melioribacteraceae bacterium]